jgi:spermidine/putrescine transport system permease protein
MGRRRGPGLPRLVLIAVLVFIYTPLVILVVNSFNASRFSTIWGGWSLKWYAELFGDRALGRSIVNTLIVAGASVTVSTILGTLAGVVLARYSGRLRRAHQVVVTLPLIMPDILMGISLLLFFIAAGIKLSLVTIIIGHITFSVSYVASTVQARFQDFDYQIIEAARDLGAGPWAILWKIYLPLLSPGIAAGAMLALTLSLDDFVITFFTAGPGSSTLPIHVYSMIRFGDPPVINALSTIFISVTFLLMLIYQRIMRRTQP